MRNEILHLHHIPFHVLAHRCITCLAVLLLSVPAFCQEGDDEKEKGFEITSITFEGNDVLSTSELQSQMTTRETPGFLNKFFYNVISERLGRKNEYFDPDLFAADLERLRKYCENRGFSEVRIDTALDFSAEDNTVDITLVIQEGYRSIVDSLAFRGITVGPSSIWEGILSAPRIQQGDPFNGSLLEEEVRRVLRILHNTGFPNALFVRDSSWARRHLSTGNYSVVLTFDLGKRCVFGDITVVQEADPLLNSVPREDITDNIILDQLDYKPGDYYSLENRLTSEHNLNRLGIFDLSRVDVRIPARSDPSTVVPSRVTVRARDKHELAPELIVSNENDAFNLGTGIGYTNRNFMGGARTFSARLRFRTQTIQSFPNYFGQNTDAVSNLDLTFEMLQPYIFSNKVKGTWAFSFIIDKQKPYLQNILRNKFGVTDRLAEYTNGYLDWTLEVIGLEKNENFRGDPNDPETARQLRLLQDQQFNSVISFTIQRDKTNDIFSPSAGFVHSATIEEAGLFPLLLKKALPKLPFTQFYRVNLQGRWYSDITTHRYAILALKLRVGLEDKYGETRSNPGRSIPQTHRFYAGGGGSVRGWNSRDLIAVGEPKLGGNVALEGSIELRTNLLQGLRDGYLDKIWVVSFLDVGTVWSEIRQIQLRDVAIAAGLGLRYDTFFGPFRIDWGFRVYNPANVRGQQWITQRKLVGQTFKEGVFHFGIGHAF